MTRRISVCMATYNGGRWVGEQLGSILQQLHADDEVVVSDDGSTDETLSVIASFRDPRVRVVPGGFRSAASNFENALRHARGDILTLSDQDDVWLEGRIPLIRERLSVPRTAVHLVALDATITDERGVPTEPSLFRKIHAGPGLLKNIYDNTYVGCCLAFTRELLDVALPFPRGIPMHDMWLGLLAERFGTVEFVNTPLLAYRRHGTNATTMTRRFEPVVQVRRRWNLATNLLRRVIDRRSR